VPDNEENKNQAPRKSTDDTVKSSEATLPTPGLAEGDEETIDEDIAQKLGDRGTQRD
jgi:hypothetical protein